jgi:Ca-activated chloride channel family protein
MGGFPIERERQVVRAIAAHLRRGDIVSAVVWNTERTVLMDGYAVTGPSDRRVLDLADRLAADGGTDVNAGLRFGYDLARRHHDARKQNRVVFISDGQANAGETEVSTIADAARDGDAEAIYLVGVGVGHGYDDTIMNELTDAGRGAYVYIDSPAEAARLFGARFDEIMEVALMDVRLQLTLPWYMAVTQFSGEEISTDPAVVREQHLAPGDAMVFHQVLEACDATEISDDDTVIARATYVRPTGRVAASDEIETTLGALLGGPTGALTRGDAIVGYAEALAAIARHDYVSAEDGHAIVDEALATVDAAPGATTDRDLVEIRRLLVAVRGLVR